LVFPCKHRAIFALIVRLPLHVQTAAVYIRPSGNAVLAEFDHGDSHSAIAPTTDHTWDVFIRLSAKVKSMAWAIATANCLVQVITGGEGQPNYVLGQHGLYFLPYASAFAKLTYVHIGTTGQQATRLM
jgi:hypothetical protein